ncbi:MAG: ATP-grasp domain-containing protein, partial [Methyloceanibacter sp.]|nr:ATP-grasp domain-containing protein [Methyloceanibacter sp.]
MPKNLSISTSVPPTGSRRTLRPSLPEHTRGSLLIAAVSGRALARAAVDAGYTPLVADFFADLDTQALSGCAREVPGDIAQGFQWETLEPILEDLCARTPSRPLGLVYGSGFEDRPQILDRIAERWPLLGNDAVTVADINDPERFFAALDRVAIRYPDTQLERPNHPVGWIAKRSGGAGGSHVAPAEERATGRNVYFQKLIPGRSVSTLFVANRKTAAVLGFSEQWTAPAEGKPWRHGGAAQPAELPCGVAERLAELIPRLAAEFQLVGLNSADFLLEDEEPFLIEINPRPGGTLDIFADATPPLLAVHLDSVFHGALPAQALRFDGATASMIVFAPGPLTIPENMDW